jgi:hypothetical protein
VPPLADVVEPALPVVLDVEEELDVVCMLVEPPLPATPPLPPGAPPSPRTIVVVSSPMHAAAKRAANESAQKARARMRLSISMVGLSQDRERARKPYELARSLGKSFGLALARGVRRTQNALIQPESGTRYSNQHRPSK